MEHTLSYMTPFHFDGHGINDCNGQRICKVTSCDPYIDGRTRNQEFDQLSNMFAAAPALLDSLKQLLYWCELHPPKGMPQSALALAQMAIGKAEGGAS